MEVISCLVPELQSEKHRGHGLQLFEKTHIFMLQGKIDTCSCKKAARKSAKTVGKDSGLHCVSRQKDNRIETGSW